MCFGVWFGVVLECLRVFWGGFGCFNGSRKDKI